MWSGIQKRLYDTPWVLEIINEYANGINFKTRSTVFCIVMQFL
jgi:hypothetical protein